MSMKAASNAAGRGDTYVRDMLERNKAPTLDHFIALAQALGVSTAYLIGETEGQPLPTRMVPLKGYLGAGGEVYAIDTGDDEVIEAPAMTAPNTVAAEVRGRSMMPAYEDGTVIYWSKLLPPEEMINRRCVVQLADGRIMVKTLRRGSAPHLWTLSSINPTYPDIEDVAVDWAAKIDWTRPR